MLVVQYKGEKNLCDGSKLHGDFFFCSLHLLYRKYHYPTSIARRIQIGMSLNT